MGVGSRSGCSITWLLLTIFTREARRGEPICIFCPYVVKYAPAPLTGLIPLTK